MQRTTILRCLFLAACLAASGTAVRADTIRFQNGRTIEGVITRETDTQVILDLGSGSTTLSRSAVAAVERASAEANDRIRAGWKQKYFLNRKYVPAGLAGLAAAFLNLGDLRAEALRTNRTLGELSAREGRLRAEREAFRGPLAQIGEEIQAASPNRNVRRYNDLIASNNALQVRSAAVNDELAVCEKDRAAIADRVTAYQDAVSSFGVRLAEEQKKPAADGAADADRKPFLDRLAQSLAEYGRDFATVAVQAMPSPGGTIVAVMVNDQVQGRFVVDTGASRVTVTENFARRLQLNPAGLPEADFTMADGHKAKGRMVVFRVLAVGDARAEDVEAAVLPGGMGDRVDGLLGMSFLKHFAVSLDGNSGTLVLRRFAPKP